MTSQPVPLPPPLTPTMRAFLRRLIKEPMRNPDLARAEKSPMRALMDRGLVQVSPDGVWTITEAGRAAQIGGQHMTSAWKDETL